MIKNLTNLDFDKEIKKSGVVVVDFFANWCAPCKALAPILEEIDGIATNCLISKVNIDEEPELAAKFNVMSIPTIIFFKNNEQVDKIVGFSSKDKIIELIEKYKKN